MRILVTYYSETGQTEKIANIIYDAVKEGHDAQLMKLKKVDKKTLDDYDLIFAGTPCHGSDLAKPYQKFLKSLPSEPKFKLVGFLTHACLPPETSEKDKILFERWVGKCETTFNELTGEKNINFLGYFRCMGAASPGIERFIHKRIITDEDEWKEYLPDLRTRPNKEDLENARKFAINTLKQLE
ncbi:MAG: flavodoxin family protein [Candidatus Heimdallarchaeota archaeon]